MGLDCPFYAQTPPSKLPGKSKVSGYVRAVTNTMKQLKFSHTQAQLVHRGEKRVTLRLGNPPFAIGDRVQLVDKTTSDKPDAWKITGEMIITGVHTQRLHDVPKELLAQTELASAGDTLISLLRRFYGEQVSEESPVSLIYFQYDPYETPRDYLAKIDSEERVSEAIMQADGGSRGNPGPSAAGFVVLTTGDERVIKSWNKYLGITTNNQAEYHAAIAGMEWCLRHNITSLHVRLDSLLVVNQLKGIFKVKNRDLWTLYEKACLLQKSFNTFSVTHVPREMNKLADSEVNKALDAVKGEELLE